MFVYVCCLLNYMPSVSSLHALHSCSLTKSCTHNSIFFVVLLLCCVLLTCMRAVATWCVCVCLVCRVVRMLPRWTHGSLRVGPSPPSRLSRSASLPWFLCCTGSECCRQLCVCVGGWACARRVGVGVGVGRLLLVQILVMYTMCACMCV